MRKYLVILTGPGWRQTGLPYNKWFCMESWGVDSAGDLHASSINFGYIMHKPGSAWHGKWIEL